MMRSYALATKMMVAVVALALVGFGVATGLERAEAQVPLPPHALSGAVTVDGQPATVGTPVVALINGNICGQATVNEQSRYVIQVKHSSAQEGCGTDGDTITFTVGGQPANETFTFKTGGSDDLDLSAAGAPPAQPTPPPPPPPVVTPTPVIVTGSGGYLDESGGGLAWWVLAAVLGGLALSAAGGWAVYRRSIR